jgi:hypothetical protein
MLGTMDDLYRLLEYHVESEGRSGDPDDLNEKRASWADAAIEAFRRQTRTDRKDALMDILCDLMHWAVREDFDFDAELGKARGHFAYETGDPTAPK